MVAPTGGMNCYFPMPFRRNARIELTNEHPGKVDGIYYQIDYTVDDELRRRHRAVPRTLAT